MNVISGKRIVNVQLMAKKCDDSQTKKIKCIYHMIDEGESHKPHKYFTIRWNGKFLNFFSYNSPPHIKNDH